MHEVETVAALTARDTGVWWVYTQGGTVHIWNLDAMTLLRSRGGDSPTGAMRFDGTPQQILDVGRWPAVGDGFVVAFQHPIDPERGVVRGSSDIVRIERAPGER